MVINIKNVLINYEVFGEGEPLLLLHGWGACINAMAPIWQFFKNKFKVFVHFLLTFLKFFPDI